MTARWGATPEDWQRFIAAGLTADILPVVSNPTASISPNSTLKDIGKTPSRYNSSRLVSGFSDWTKHQSTPEEVARWSKEADYGICLQARAIRAIDIDIPDKQLAAKVLADVLRILGVDAPVRSRSNSGKCLVAFRVDGQHSKRVLKCPPHGIIEFLADGQQFIAAGMHRDGVPYSWSGPDEFPTIPADVYEQVFDHLATAYATEVSRSRASVRGEVLANAISEDPIAQALYDRAMVLREDGDKLVITCPWAEEHTTDSSDTATIYYPAHTGGFPHGGFDCKHGHCADRTVKDLNESLFPSCNDFDDIPDEIELDETGEPIIPVVAPSTGTEWFKHHVPFEMRPIARYLIKNMLPSTGVASIFGASGSGKSFFALDMVMAIVRDQPWRGHRVHGGAVAYLCAEGFTDFQDRVDAIGLHQKVDPTTLPLYLMGKGLVWKNTDSIKALIAELRKIPGLRLLVVDTLSKVLAGENENAAEVMTLAVKHAEEISRVLGILVLVIHHTGKDEAKGLRGHSALEAGIDAAIQVARPEKGDARTATVTKMKGGADGAQFNFKLELMSLNRVDEDGDQLFSCIVEDSSPPVVSKKPGKNHAALAAEFDIAFDLTEEPVNKMALVLAACERRGRDGDTIRKQTMLDSLTQLVNKGAYQDTAAGITRG
jgi:hypothetical protein